MRWLSDHSVSIIIVLAFIHMFFFAGLWWSRGKQCRRLKCHLQDILKDFSGTTDINPDRPLDETIDCFLHDIRHVLADPQATVELSRRLAIKDEAKKYLVKHWFETFYNAARTFIEAYPLMGILGTVLAIGVGLNAPGLEGGEAATRIVGDFKNAIWSTVWGLIFGVGFLVLNSVLEPSFERLTEHRKAVRDVIQTAKQTLFRRQSQGGEP